MKSPVTNFVYLGGTILAVFFCMVYRNILSSVCKFGSHNNELFKYCKLVVKYCISVASSLIVLFWYCNYFS